MKSIDDELAALFAELGVAFEDAEEDPAPTPALQAPPTPRYSYGARPTTDDADEDDDADAVAELSLFQSSREHYGVFYRLDLTQGVPQLRIYIPEEEGTLKLRCYLVRAARHTPLHDWFVSTRRHDGSRAYDDARDSAQQHLLFAAGELMKRLFWTGDIEAMDYPTEIAVARVA